MPELQEALFGVSDMERLIYGQSSKSRSARQRAIRRALRCLGEGVGQGRRYQWTQEKLHDLVPIVREKVKRLAVLTSHA